MSNEIAAAPAEDGAFWRFSLEFYARPDVAEALIALQDRAGFDVNLMLFALWLGSSGRPPLDAAGLAAAEAAIRPIRVGVAEPLRRIRRGLKDDPAPDIQALRDRIKGLELAAEKTAQERLAALATAAQQRPAKARRAAAESNLALYLGTPHAAAAEAALLCDALAAAIAEQAQPRSPAARLDAQ